MNYACQNTPVFSLFLYVLKPSYLSGIALNIGPREARIVNKHTFLQWIVQVSERRTHAYTKDYIFAVKIDGFANMTLGTQIYV